MEAVGLLTPDQVRTQIENLLADVRIDAVKIGMLGSAAVIETVADALEAHPEVPWRVLDPVMVASSGDRLLDEDAVDALRSRLVPTADVITPNLAEAAVLLDLPEPPPEPTEDLAARLAQLGAGVMLKGGHGTGDSSEDILLVGGDKSDDWKGWYEVNIPVADDRFDDHQAALTAKRTKKSSNRPSKSNRKTKGKNR